MWQQVELALSQSAHRALVTLANFLPGLLALGLAVLILTAIGALLAVLLRRFLTAIRFDERLSRNPLVPHPLRPNCSRPRPRHRPRLPSHRQPLARTKRRHRNPPPRPHLQKPHPPGNPPPLLATQHLVILTLSLSNGAARRTCICTC